MQGHKIGIYFKDGDCKIVFFYTWMTMNAKAGYAICFHQCKSVQCRANYAGE